MKFIKFLLIAYFTIKCTSTFGYCQSIEPLLSFKIDSQLRVFENRDKLSPSVNNDILYIVENYHEGGYSYLSGSNLETKTRSRDCLLYTSPSPRDATLSRMPSSA